MAPVRLSDVIVPELFENYGSLHSLEFDTLVQSGLAVADSNLNTLLANTGGKSLEIPYWKELTIVEPNVASDDPSAVSTPQGHGSDFMQGVRQFVNQSWSAMDVAGLLAGSDPAADIRSKVEEYWTADRRARVINTAIGIMADSVTNHGSDLVHNISLDDSTAASSITDANLISANAVIEACGKMGDRQANITVIAVHSVVYTRLQKLNLIDFVRDSESNIMFATYLGKLLLVDDTLPVVAVGSAGTAKIEYTSFLFGRGVFGMGTNTSNSAFLPTEVLRVPGAGNGSGQEVFWSRRQWAVHPYGYKFDLTAVSATELAPTYAALRDGTHWTRSWTNRKRIQMVALVTNG